MRLLRSGIFPSLKKFVETNFSIEQTGGEKTFEFQVRQRSTDGPVTFTYTQEEEITWKGYLVLPYFRMYHVTLLLGLLMQKLSATASSISNENHVMRCI